MADRDTLEVGVFGVAVGIARLDRHADDALRLQFFQRSKIGIETDCGPWVASLVAAGYEVFAINPLSAAHSADASAK